jgi:hypothetical protein
MKVKDQQAYDEWKANQKGDPYGLACFSYAERWASMMEAEMEETPEADFAELAKRLSNKADVEGITGFMYGMAVNVLSKCWVNGELLRRWHNGEYNVSEEQAKGGVVNPAIINIQVSD